eukprot:scaffold3722_cov263-Pinguiococcus_pyrenoidosus.AAC.7
MTDVGKRGSALRSPRARGGLPGFLLEFAQQCAMCAHTLRLKTWPVQRCVRSVTSWRIFGAPGTSRKDVGCAGLPLGFWADANLLSIDGAMCAGVAKKAAQFFMATRLQSGHAATEQQDPQNTSAHDQHPSLALSTPFSRRDSTRQDYARRDETRRDETRRNETRPDQTRLQRSDWRQRMAHGSSEAEAEAVVHGEEGIFPGRRKELGQARLAHAPVAVQALDAGLVGLSTSDAVVQWLRQRIGGLQRLSRSLPLRILQVVILEQRDEALLIQLFRRYPCFARSVSGMRSNAARFKSSRRPRSTFSKLCKSMRPRRCCCPKKRSTPVLFGRGGTASAVASPGTPEGARVPSSIGDRSDSRVFSQLLHAAPFAACIIAQRPPQHHKLCHTHARVATSCDRGVNSR